MSNQSPTPPSGVSENEERFLRALTSVTIQFIPRESAQRFVEALAPVLKEFVQAECEESRYDGALTGTLECLKANFGTAMGQALFDLLTGRASKSNSDLVNGAVSRAAVSKAFVRLRRGYKLSQNATANASAEGSQTP